MLCLSQFRRRQWWACCTLYISRESDCILFLTFDIKRIWRFEHYKLADEVNSSKFELKTFHALFTRWFELSKLADNVKCLYIYFQATYINSAGKMYLAVGMILS